MRYFKTLLGWLTQRAIVSEQTHRERELLRENRQLQQEIESLQITVEVKEKEIDRLEHQNDLLTRDLEGLGAINSRNLTWIENIRNAEEPKITREMLEQLLGNSHPWDAS